MADDEAAYEIATAARLRAAEMFAGLSPEQWRTPSLCAGWTVREVAAHLVEAVESRVGMVGLVVAVVRHRGDLDRWVDLRARETARRTTDDLVASLRSGAMRRMDPPAIGPRGPMCDGLVHVRDAARPLGLDVDAPAEHWREALEFLLPPRRVTQNFVRADRVAGLRLVATDQDWSYGDGAEVRGPSEAVTMAICGRAHALADLSGDGVELLEARLR